MLTSQSTRWRRVSPLQPGTFRRSSSRPAPSSIHPPRTGLVNKCRAIIREMCAGDSIQFSSIHPPRTGLVNKCRAIIREMCAGDSIQFSSIHPPRTGLVKEETIKQISTCRVCISARISANYGIDSVHYNLLPVGAIRKSASERYAISFG